MASCSMVWSGPRMPSNSSMQHSPPSASTSAPASKLHCPPSFRAATVSPAPGGRIHTHTHPRGKQWRWQCDHVRKCAKLLTPSQY
jgi:quercetin dioxygenase-like cupin family protein